MVHYEFRQRRPDTLLYVSAAGEAVGVRMVRGSPLDIWGRPGVFAWLFLFISQERLKALIFSPQDRLEIFISIFILYLFQPPVWVK